MLDESEAEAARAEPVPTARHPFPMIAAHAAEEALAADPGNPVIRLSLDARLQASLEALAAERAAAAGPALSAAIIVLDNRDGWTIAGSGARATSTRAGAALST